MFRINVNDDVHQRMQALVSQVESVTGGTAIPSTQDIGRQALILGLELLQMQLNRSAAAHRLMRDADTGSEAADILRASIERDAHDLSPVHLNPSELRLLHEMLLEYRGNKHGQ